MVLIKRILLSALLLAAALPGFSQAGNTVLLSAEIQGIEKKLASGLPQGERKKALVSLGRLFELSGNMEGAAKAWNDAALSGERDAPLLLRSAACFAAMGEFTRAEGLAGPLSGSEGPVGMRANYLRGQIEGLKSGRTDILRSLLQHPSYGEFKPGIYYSLWKIEGDQLWRKKLLDEYPKSPEGLIISGESASNPAISALPTALWLFMGAEPDITAAIRSPAANPPAQPGDPQMLQTGLFSREENARALADRLYSAGFSPLVSPRTVNGVSYWAVGVQPGQDYNRTILLLKNAGFEAFPVF